MKNQQHNSTAGIRAMQPEGYAPHIKSEVRRQKTDYTWWSTPAFIIFLTISMSVLDALVLFDILDAAMTQSEYMGKIVSFGVALVLNMIPLLIAKFAHQAIYKISKKAVVWVVVGITAFVILFSSTVALRFAYQDHYGEGDTHQLTNQMELQDESQQPEETSSNPKGLAVVLLLSVEPLVTSVINFCLAFITDDEVKKRINHLRKRKIELAEERGELKAYLGISEDPDEWRDKALKQDELRRIACEEDIRRRGDILKAKARFYLAEYLGDPEGVSYVTRKETEAL